MTQALGGKDITLYGDGEQSRSFCYVDDMIDALLRMMNTHDKFTEPVNIGNPCEFSMIELAKKVVDITGSKSRIVFEALPQDDPRHRKPDITMAPEKLGGSPTGD